MITIETLGAVLVPLAQRSTWSRLGERFSGRHLFVQPEDIIGGLALLVGLAVVVGGLVWLSKLKESQAVRPSPRRLLRELCAAHRLSSSEKRLLHTLAANHGLSEPAGLFVQPELLAKETSAEAVALRERLFGVG